MPFQLNNVELTPFEAEQMLHLATVILDHSMETEHKRFLESISYVWELEERKDKTEFERVLNESEHIYKYMYALNKLIKKFKNES